MSKAGIRATVEIDKDDILFVLKHCLLVLEGKESAGMRDALLHGLRNRIKNIEAA